MSKITVIHHSADFDGLFCREIAKKFLPDAQLIGWDFKDKPLNITDFPEGTIYILDLPVDQVFGYNFATPAAVSNAHHVFENIFERIIWIDHHKSSIVSHPTHIKGYRIDGVAACRLTYQWFLTQYNHIPLKLPIFEDYGVMTNKIRTDYRVVEPLAVRLAGEYDIWDKRVSDVDTFQYGLKSQVLKPNDWNLLLDSKASEIAVGELLQCGQICEQYQKVLDSEVVNARSFVVEFEGLKFLALTTARCSSLTFASRDIPETGHDALMGFYYDGKVWRVSLYHAKHRKDLDLSKIAVKYKGGGHAGACGFSAKQLPFMIDMNLLCGLYGTAYRAGHNDTVEGIYTDVHPRDDVSAWTETVNDFLKEN